MATLGELWPPIKQGLKWVWHLATSFISLFSSIYEVAGWLLAILMVLSAITVIILIFNIKKQSPEPHSQYIEDILFGMRWRWQWCNNAISNLWCYCIHCDSELVYCDDSNQLYSRESAHTKFICEHCSRNIMGRIDGGNKDYALDSVRREIRRRIRTNQFPIKNP